MVPFAGNVATGAKLAKRINKAVNTAKKVEKAANITQPVVKKAVQQVSRNFNKISDDLLKRAGVDAHQLKRDFLGSKAKISLYDLYKDTKTGEILILLKGGKGTPIPTGEFLK